ncbi:HAMP domain-containing histidine kinase [Desulfosarcina sp. OttesenSCG-928-A07]|nr:HAMP domain-containing histidine kinase [Desulfosarcina sp. OttesenSCG-928-G17]MDL2328757.1 HAMP domain-containing histidine kinase [Desulfosarcina sp. OttesenSCG-928-A07]
MKQMRWLFHPILVFIFSVLALMVSLSLYIYWYVEVSSGLRAVIERFNIDADPVFSVSTWVVILVLSILIGTILLGIFIIFVFSQKTLQLYRLQNNFISNFTHELKTPVTSLQLYLQTFAKHELPRAEQLKYIEYMLIDINRLTSNINQILNLARLESKRYVGEFVVADIRMGINLFLEENAHLFASCRIRTHLPEETVYCRLNKNLFEMLLMNLFTNAMTYNDSDTPEIDVFLEPGTKWIHIRCVDNGIGFDPKERKKIFNKFYQIGRPDDMTAKGSGLGLYLIQIIARLHKGKVTAESQGPGKGASFIVALPVLT